MKKIVITLSLVLLTAISFSFASNLQYVYGYNFSQDASTTFSGILTNMVFEKETDNAYFRLSMDLSKFDLGKNTSLLNQTQYVSTTLLSLPNVKLPWMLYVVNEAYANIYIGDSTLTVGRFILQNGSSTLYSPSVLLPAHDFLNPFNQSKTLPIDGIKFSSSIGDDDYSIYWTPITYDDLPSALVYPNQINSNILLKNSYELSSSFKENKSDVEISTEQLKASLKEKGLTDVQIAALLADPELLASYGFTSEQIAAIELGETLMTLPSTYTITDYNVANEKKDILNPKNSNVSVSLSGDLLGYDYKLALTHDHYHFMVPKSVDVKYSKEGTGTANTIMYRPLRDALSLDVQGVSKFFKSIAYHGEFSFIRPETPYTMVNTTYYVPNKLSPTNTTMTTDSTKVNIFNDYYFKAVVGLEYSKGEDFLLGAEVFNGLATEELKDHISFGADSYMKVKKDDFSFEGLGLVDFSKINDSCKPAFMMNATLSYDGIDNFKPSLKVQYTYVKDQEHSLYSFKKLNSIELCLKSYF